jgi:hypothetical protein
LVAGKKVLCAAAPTYGHTIPVLRLASALRDWSNDVALLARTEEMARVAKDQHVLSIAVPDSPEGQRPDDVILPIIEAHRPDITICDWEDYFWLALRRYRPACRISILRCEQIIGYERRNRFLYDHFHLEDGAAAKWVNSALHERGCAPVVDPRELYIADIIAIPSVPQLDPIPDPVSDLYAKTIFVHTGPPILKDGAPISEALCHWLFSHRERGTPVVLITLGTAWGEHVYGALADCFGGGEFAVLMIIPHERCRLQLKQRDETWLYISDFTNLLELAKQSDLIVHHCGHATLQTALLAGKPSLTLPSGEYDREDNALRMEDLNCGRHLGHDFFRRGIKAGPLRRAARGVMRSPDISLGVAAMSKVVREQASVGGMAELARAIAGVVSE